MGVFIAISERGLVIKTTGPGERPVVSKRIRALLPRDSVFSSREEIVVPPTAAFLIAQEFVADDVVWSDQAQALLREQRMKLSKIASARFEVAEALSDPRRAIGSYPLINRLDEHQIEAVAAMTVPSLIGLALFDEQGLGKTISALCAFDLLHSAGRLKYLLVVAPKSVLASWLGDIKKVFGQKYAVKAVGGSQWTRRERIRSRFDILLCNYESMVSERELMKRTITNREGGFMLVIDESYFVKNPAARRSRAVQEIRSLCNRTVLLCGSPAPNSPRDLLNQIKLTDDGLSLSNRAIPEEQESLSRFVSLALDNIIFLRRLKHEVYPTIPGKEIDRVFIALRPQQLALYARAKHELVLAVRTVDDREFKRNLGDYLARRVTLLQICSHPGGLDPLYTEDPAKLLALDKLLRDLIDEQREKVVIWSFFRYTLQAIADRYKRYGLVRIDGSVAKVEDRIDAINRFQTDPNIRIFLGNAAAAGAGITLTAARHAIYESFSNQAAHYMQSVDRIHRRGQERDVVYHVLLANDTIEEREFDHILRKERAGRDLLGDHYKEPMTRERFLTELGESLNDLK